MARNAVTKPAAGQQQQSAPPNALQVLRTDLERMKDQFRAVLPPDMPPERFIRHVLTAMQNNPKLWRCEYHSVLNAAMKSAQDGLLPDGREGVIVPYQERDSNQLKAQWMPMIFGIRHKVMKTGLLRKWEVFVVHEGDLFEFELGDHPFIRHKPAARGGRTRPVIAAYSVATYPDGTQSFEVMNIDEIEDVRKRYARSERGPWADPVAYPEMCRKTVARLHAKQLPQSSDLERMLSRDDFLYSLDRKPGEQQRLPGARPRAIAQAFDSIAGGGPGGTTEGLAFAQPEPDEQPELPPADEPAGEQAADNSTTKVAGPPTNPAEYRAFVRKVISLARTPQEIQTLDAWWNGSDQQRMRGACGVTQQQYDEMADWIRDAKESVK